MLLGQWLLLTSVMAVADAMAVGVDGVQYYGGS